MSSSRKDDVWKIKSALSKKSGKARQAGHSKGGFASNFKSIFLIPTGLTQPKEINDEEPYFAASTFVSPRSIRQE